MPGANLGFKLVRMDSTGETVAMLGRFPAGFERHEPGGYVASEEFLVLEGYLDLEGVRYRPGDLTLIPRRFLRTAMSAPEGCTVLAWFGGPAIWRPESELKDAATEGVESVSIAAAPAGYLLSAPEADWTKHNEDEPDAVPEGDAVDAALTQWWRTGLGAEPEFAVAAYVVREQH
ncbi:MAG TPA: hypothetical protein VFD59_18335 [Nocardioidaceae bacterium]|nr:hypothetical protein [Nocardioidaceae bacterium]